MSRRQEMLFKRSRVRGQVSNTADIHKKTDFVASRSRMLPLPLLSGPTLSVSEDRFSPREIWNPLWRATVGLANILNHTDFVFWQKKKLEIH